MGVAHGCSGIAVTQQFLHLIERVPGIDQKAGKGVPQVMDAHIGKAQPAPQPVPEKIDVAERLARRMAGKKPRAARPARQVADDGHGRVGQGEVARLAGLGQRHGELR